MTWGIVSYHVGQMPGRDFIVSSIGKPKRELQKIARRLNSNGEGQRYTVREYCVARTAEAGIC